MKHGNLIGGEWVPARSGRTRPDLNPTRAEEILAEFPESAGEDVAAAVAAAAGAFPAWKAASVVRRGDILYKAAEILASRAEGVARDLSLEEGKTLEEARGETLRAVAIFRYFAAQAREAVGEVYAAAQPSTMLFTRREPLGVVGAITPWNFPIAVPAWKLAPALVYGNTVVWKPSELTPLTSWNLASALQDAGLPAGVLNVVFGSGEVGSALVEDSAVKAVSFTGSNATGRKIYLACAARGAKCQTEMGGKNALVVLADADVDLAVDLAVSGAFRSAGQKCTATSRIIVEQPILAEFADALAERVRTLAVGDPLDPATYLGPVVSSAQQEKVLGYVEAARQEGARLLVGGAAGDERGFFVLPTVFTDVLPEMQLAREEIFGPVVGLIPARDYGDAVARANAVSFGLSASVVTRDLGRALAFIRDSDCGIVHVNSETAGAEPHVPFGGTKESSSGTREQGKAAREFYTQVKTVYLDPPRER